MATVQLVDPKTGDVYDVDESQAADAAANNGFVLATPEVVAEYDRVKTLEQAPLADKAARTAKAATFGLTRGVTQLSNVIEKVPGLGPTPEEEAGRAELEAKLYGAEAEELRKDEPIASMVGEGLPLAVAGGGLGGVGLKSAAAIITAESAVEGASQEDIESRIEQRPFSVEAAASNGVLNLLFAGAGLGAAKLYRAVAPTQSALRETAAKAYRGRVSRAVPEDLADPTVARDFLARNSAQMDETVSAIDEVVQNYRPAVANNPVAQRNALQGIADGFRARDSAFAEALDEAIQMPRQDRFRALVQLQEQATGDAAAALDDLIKRPSLWGEKAVAHAETLAAARGARGGDPALYAEAVRSVDDDSVRRLLGDLDEQLGDATATNAAQAFRQARSVGAAAADGGEALSEDTIRHYLTRDDEVVDNIKELAGGALGTSEKGAVQRTFDAFGETTNNATKRADFAAATPTDTATRALLGAQRVDYASQLEEVARRLDAHGVKGRANALRGIAGEIKAAPLEEVTGLMDQSKQLLDRLHLAAITNKTEVWKSRDILDAVDPAVERGRAILENPDYVGRKIADLQTGRNAAWSDKNTGFIRNINVAESLGVKLMRKVDVDYNTGRLVMEFDPSSIDSLLRLDAHQAKPVLQAWANVLDSMERMAKNTVEAGASSVGKSPIGELLTGIEDMRDIFRAIDTRLTVQRMASQGLAGNVEAAGRFAERLPLVGEAIKAARQVDVLKTAEGAAKAKLAKPVPVGSTEASRAYLRAQQIVERRRGQTGAVTLGKLKPEFSLEGKTLRDLGHREVQPEKLASIREKHPEFLETGRYAGDEDGISLIWDPPHRGRPGQLKLNDGRHRFATALEEGMPSIYGTIRHPGSGKILFRGDIPLKAPTDAGFVGSGPGIGGILSSPMGVVSALGLGALGAGKAYSSARDYIRNLVAPPQSPALGEFATEAEAAAYLEAQYEADVQFTSRALTDPDVAAEYARRNKDEPSTLEKFQGVHATPEQAYMEMRASVQSMRQNPMSLIEQMGESIGDAPEQLRAEMASKAFQVAQYLETKLPPLRGVSVTRPNGLPPSRLEVRTFALHYMAATDPSTVFDDAKRGRLRHEQLETLKAVWPKHYDDLYTSTLLGMGNGRSTVQQRQRADLLFGFGSALDPAFSPRLSQAAQAAREAQKAPPPGSAPTKTRISGPMQAGGLSALSLGAAAPPAQ